MRHRFLFLLLTLFLQALQGESLALVASRQLTNHSSEVQSNIRPSRVKATIYSSYTSKLDFSRHTPTDIAVESNGVNKIFFTANAATKWIVSLAVTIGVFWRPRNFQGPYIVVGSIAATYLATFLKKTINQGRPDGAPFSDPGMPSSHAMVSFFVATAWLHALGGKGAPLFLGSALFVSILRVVCGYHTIPQIAVGGSLGTFLGHTWMSLGFVLAEKSRTATLTFAWSAYLVGSVIYIKKNVLKWISDENYL